MLIWGNKKVSSKKIHKMEAKGDVKGLINALEHEERMVRMDATKALLTLGVKDPKAVDPLIAILKKDPIDCGYAIQLLGEIGDLKAVKPIKKVVPIGQLWGYVDDALKKLRLKKQEEGKGDQPKAKSKRNGSSHHQRKKQESVKGRKKEHLFTKVLHGIDPYNQTEIEDARRDLNELEMVDSVIEGLKDIDEHVQYQAVLASELIEDSKVIRPLIDLLTAGNKEVRRFAAQMLGEKGDTKAVKPLIQILKDEDEDDSIRQATSYALEKIGTTEALDAIDEYWI